MGYLGTSPPNRTLTSADIDEGAVTLNDISFTDQPTNLNLIGTYDKHTMRLADGVTVTGDVTISDNLILSKLSDDGNAITLTNDTSTRTITGTGSLEASTLSQTPNASLTGMTGELGAGVTGANSFDLVNKPSFRATHSGALSVNNETWTGFGNKAEMNAGNCYDGSTYKFTPNEAGWYWLHCQITFDDIGDGKNLSAGIFKNATSGSPTRTRDMRVGSSSGAKGINISTIEYANGTTDYFWFAGYHAHGSARSVIGGNYSITMGFKLAIGV